jgi:hypothetical protein
MTDLAHLFGFGGLIIIGRASPGLLVEAARRAGEGVLRPPASVRRPRAPAAASSSPIDLSLEQTP